MGGGRNKLQLFVQRHSQVATVISKGFCNNIQCGCGVSITGGIIRTVVDVKRIFLCYGPSQLLWLISRLLIGLNSCALPTEGLDSSWFSTSQHVTGQSIN